MNAFTFYDLHRIAYADALERQTSAFNALLENKREGKPGENCLFFCEHEPVFTIGKSGKDSNLLIPESLLAERGISLYHIARGGDITYHGPGQITGYPVFDLERWHLGLKAYIARLEEAIILFLRLYDIKGERITLLEAIAKAGDVTDEGRVDRVAVIREYGNKRRIQFHDLRSREIFNSQCYYLQQNDIVYVEPSSAKARDNAQRTFSMFSMALSFITTITSIIVMAVSK